MRKLFLWKFTQHLKKCSNIFLIIVALSTAQAFTLNVKADINEKDVTTFF